MLELSIISAFIPISLTTKSAQQSIKYTVFMLHDHYSRHLKHKTILANAFFLVLFFQCVQATCKAPIMKFYEYVISWFSFCVMVTCTYQRHELHRNTNVLVTYLKDIFHLQKKSSAICSPRLSSFNERLKRVFVLVVLCTGIFLALYLCWDSTTPNRAKRH